jgi:hypothetical protein
MSECNNGSCDSGKGSCESKPSSSDGCNIAEDILCLAKSAKHELLKEKMKKGFEAKMGKKLDKIAEVAVDAVLACLEHKMAAKQGCEEYQAKLFAAFKG